MATNQKEVSVTLRGEPWLTIDIKGFAQILRNKGIARIALEPISNALDTEATEIFVTFNQHDRWASLTVTDNDPNGFADLNDAHTMFAPSKRRNDVTKRGRFGAGDKELIAICANGGAVEVHSTTGTILFGENGRTRSRRKRQDGTKLVAHFRCTQAQAAEFEELVRSLIVPDGVKLFLNAEIVTSRTPIKVVRETLPTTVVDDEGNLVEKKSGRVTDVELYEPAEGETACIYELGVPVVEHDGRWHVNVMQKVPLNQARDNVKAPYLRRIREIMLNEGHELLTSVDVKSTWVTDALPNATEAALKTYVDEKYGKNAVIDDPSNPEATKRAIDQGRYVVRGRSESAGAWARIKEHSLLRPAGQVIQVGIPTDPNGIPPIPRKDWTPDMVKLASYVSKVGEHLIGFKPSVEFAPTSVSTGGKRIRAGWAGGTITFYLRNVGKNWPSTCGQEEVDELTIHECSHHGHPDHYTDGFIHKLGELGAKLRSCKVRWIR